MKIAGLLSFYDESPAWLATAVAGMGRVCDLIVGHDGAYSAFPGCRPRSHPQQSEAILQAAEALDVACLIYRPSDIYHENEIGKRNEGMRITGSLLEVDVDWLLVFDADYHMLRCDPELVRAKLADTEHDVATYTLLSGMDVMADEYLADYAKHRRIDTEWTSLTRDIYRWHPSLRVGPLHWAYTARRNGRKQWLRGPWTDDRLSPALDLRENLVAYHRTGDRAKVRKDAAKGYYTLRAKLNLEPLEECATEPKEEHASQV